MKRNNYILIMTSIAFILIVIIILFLFPILNSSDNNFNKIKEYFGQTRNSSSNFLRSHKERENDTVKLINDTIKITEHIEQTESTIFYNIQLIGLRIGFDFSTNVFEVTKDSCKGWSIFERWEYTRPLKDLLTIPEFIKIPDSAYYDKSKNKNYFGPTAYRSYLSMNDSVLIIHRDYEYKTERNWSFYFSKKMGLYKIIIVEGYEYVLTKITKE